MDQDALFNFINDTFGRIETRLNEFGKESNENSKQLQTLTGEVKQWSRRFEFDIKQYFDEQIGKIKDHQDRITVLEQDRIRVSTIIWGIGILWVVLTGWVTGLGGLISNFFHSIK